MVSSHDQDEIVERVLASIGRVISFDIGVVLRASERTAEEPLYVKSYTPQSIDKTLVSLAQRRVAENYEVLSSNLIGRRGVRPELRDGVATTTRDEGLPSLLSVPLLLGDRLLGLLELNNTEPDAYDESDLRVLFTVANSLATALENATLMEALRARAHELERADHLRGNIVQNISHELRNPLTFLTGYIGLMQGSELGPLTEEQEHGLEVIAAKVDTLANLVDDFVTLNSISPDTLQRALRDINVLIEEAVEGVEGSASERGLRVQVQTPATPQLAQVDPRRFNQAIDNLLSNALKFSDEGGRIVARVVDLDERVRVEVEDHGVGISPEVQVRIFDRFYQADRDTARKMKGMGLGMAISKEIVEAHGGVIGVESVPGEGSTFYIELAKHTPSTGDSPASRPPASAA
jgi:signal transduction histidine kinase